MSAVSPISPTNGGAAAPPPTTQIGPQAGQTEMNQFLTLLTTQLKNQDPTQPTDPTQFVAQLAQFSTVEQLTQSNTTLTSISSSLNGVALGQYSALINHSIIGPAAGVTVPASGPVSTQMTFTITDPSLTRPYVAVTNDSGTLVTTLPVSGATGTVTFDGTDGRGNALPPGQYSVALVGTATGAAAGTTSSAGTLTTTGIVANVTQGANGTWNLELQNGQILAANSVMSAS
jgi:flagellar basal-body rod modification protein FlgD